MADAVDAELERWKREYAELVEGMRRSGERSGEMTYKKYVIIECNKCHRPFRQAANLAAMASVRDGKRRRRSTSTCLDCSLPQRETLDDRRLDVVQTMQLTEMTWRRGFMMSQRAPYWEE